MHDYISFKMQQVEELKYLEGIAKIAEGHQTDYEAKKKASDIEDALFRDKTGATFAYIEVTRSKNEAENFRTTWQQQRNKPKARFDCLEELTTRWQQGRAYYEQELKTPRIDLKVLPAYSFSIQFTFTLAQPYISRDEENFYIIDNPVRKEKVFGLPYIAASSWKGSLRSAFAHLNRTSEKESTTDRATLMRLFGNEKNEGEKGENAEFRSGRLCFCPTFFEKTGLEMINPQDRILRSGKDPVPIECVPLGSDGTFTLLYVPFDRVGENAEETRRQVAGDLEAVLKGLHAMLFLYGFGAKTHSGYGLIEKNMKNVGVEMHASNIEPISRNEVDFEALQAEITTLAGALRSGGQGE